MTNNTNSTERGPRYGEFAVHSTISQAIQDAMRGFPEGWARLSPVQRQALSCIADKMALIVSGDPNYVDKWHAIQTFARLVEERIPGSKLESLVNDPIFAATAASVAREELPTPELEQSAVDIHQEQLDAAREALAKATTDPEPRIEIGEAPPLTATQRLLNAQAFERSIGAAPAEPAAKFPQPAREVHMDPATGPDKQVEATFEVMPDGTKNLVALEFDESRADVIGQNGNDGEHYRDLEQREQAEFNKLCATLDVPLQQPRLPEPTKPKTKEQELPNTDAMVDPTGRPTWSNVPAWVKWIAQDRAGVWKGFAARPEAKIGKWHTTKRFIEINSGEVLAGDNWVHTLEERP